MGLVPAVSLTEQLAAAVAHLNFSCQLGPAQCTVGVCGTYAGAMDQLLVPLKFGQPKLARRCQVCAAHVHLRLAGPDGTSSLCLARQGLHDTMVTA
jgi:hypothetical protein